LIIGVFLDNFVVFDRMKDFIKGKSIIFCFFNSNTKSRESLPKEGLYNLKGLDIVYLEADRT
jgi:hypothetical protein